MSVKFLTVRQILQLHEQLMGRFGGRCELKQPGRLEAAVLRPRQTFDGEPLYATLFGQAAALMESLSQNHPFIDGNKRTAWVAAVVFLDINGVSLRIDVNEAEPFVMGVAMGEIKFEDMVPWLEAHRV